MQEIHHHAGNLIFKEGEEGDTVAYILAGRVEVLKKVNSHEVVLGDVGAGEFVGEMSVIEGRPRAASVRAKTDVELRLLDRDEFTARVGHEPEVALQIIVRLSERLRGANEQIAELQTDPVPEASAPSAKAVTPASATPGSLRLFPDSGRLQSTLPAEGLVVDALPFHVGRPAGRRERPASVALNLMVPDVRPYRLSRAHFTIIRNGDAFAVRDVRSHLGTIVDGELIGQHAPKTMVDLKPGEHRIVAGGKDSPYVFRAVVAGA